MLKYFKYFRIAMKYIAMAEEHNLLQTIENATKDKKLTINELIEIGKKICEIAEIDIDTKGIKL